MKFRLLTLFAETSLHPGAGRDTGVVDLPVAREAVTNFPVIVGSSLKGALHDAARGKWRDVEDSTNGKRRHQKVEQLFGKHDNAGALLVHDARLLLLPVRSLDTHFRWVTCPQILGRLVRDLDRGQASDPGSVPKHPFEIPMPPEGHYFGDGPDPLVLEERLFQWKEKTIGWVDLMRRLFPTSDSHKESRRSLEIKFTVLSDTDFTWFANYALPVNARNKLNTDNKTSENLWYEETIPPDTLFYSLIATRGSDDKSLQDFDSLFEGNAYLQVGGNETVGMGWCACSLPNGKEVSNG